MRKIHPYILLIFFILFSVSLYSPRYLYSAEPCFVQLTIEERTKGDEVEYKVTSAVNVHGDFEHLTYANIPEGNEGELILSIANNKSEVVGQYLLFSPRFYSIDYVDTSELVETDSGSSVIIIPAFANADKITVFGSTKNHVLNVSQKILSCGGAVPAPSPTPVLIQAPIQAPSQVVYARTLRVGDRGNDVIALQTFLENNGFLRIPANVSKGYYGGLTRSAVSKYQASVGILPATGTFGTKTRTYTVFQSLGIPVQPFVNIPSPLPTASQTPSPSPSISPTPSATVTPRPVRTVTPSPTSTYTATPTASQTPSPSPSATATASPSASPSPTASSQPSYYPSPSTTPSPSASPSSSASPSPSGSYTASPSVSASADPVKQTASVLEIIHKIFDFFAGE